MTSSANLSSAVDCRVLDSDAVLRLLPHRKPFLFVDHAELDLAGGRSRTWRRFVIDEPYFEGHFPGAPIVPGVVLLECMAQAGRLLLNAQAGGIRPGFLVGVDVIKFTQSVRPGDLLRTEALHCGESELSAGKSASPIHRFKCAAYVGGKRCARARIHLYQAPVPQAGSAMAATPA